MNKSPKKSKKIYYLTFSYYPSGVFKSQIFDVIRLLRENTDYDIRLISFFSVRVYFKCRKWVKQEMPDAIVLPIIFGMKRWKRHSSLLRFVANQEDYFIGRNPMGSKVALGYSPNVIYDGRSALKGEIEEYNMALKDALNRSFIDAEKYVVNHAKHRLAVSSELIEFWKKDLGYSGNEHTIIPCSLAYSHNQALIPRPVNTRIRLLFAGGGSPWQGQDSKYKWIEALLAQRDDTEFIFLSKPTDFIADLKIRYPNRVSQKWVQPEEVFKELTQADYGILLREDNLTNRVSSPVKFAEYLNAGLHVIISSCVKDFATFVRQNECGVVMDQPDHNIKLSPRSKEERLSNRHLAEKHFSKKSTAIIRKYQTALDAAISK